MFEQALRLVVNETEALRVQIVERGDGPCQVIKAATQWSLAVIDVSAEADARALAEAWMERDLARPVAPTRGPLFGYALFKASPHLFFWYARYHHIVMDGFGMALVARRVAEVYSALSSGRPQPDNSFGPLAALVEDDVAYRASDQFKHDSQFWCNYLADRPQPRTLGDNPSVKLKGFLRCSGFLRRSSLDRISTTAGHLETSIPQIATAISAIFLHRLTGAEDLIFGLAVAARTRASRCIPGMLSNGLPLRLKMRAGMTVSEVVNQTAQQMRQALKHKRSQIADLRQDL